MGSPCPPHWTFAARAAYFGERLCAFCDHRNPAGARFCNDCASPLHLKPCAECDAVNDQSASSCHRCGAACPVHADGPDDLQAPPTANAAPGGATAADDAVTPARQSVLPTSPWRAGLRVVRSGEFLVAAIAMVVMSAAYEAYRVHVSQRGAVDVAARPAEGVRNVAAPAAPIAAVVAEAMPADSADTANVAVAEPAASVETPPRAIVRRAAPPVAARHVAGAQPNTARERQVPVRRTAPVAYRPVSAGAGAPAAHAGHEQPDRWKAMHASLASCGGDLLARIACDQRVRRRYCDGYWGVAPDCAGRIANEHGQ